jgi:hypothetical protein
MKIKPAIIAGLVGSILAFATPLVALLLVYLSPVFFISPLAIICRWCGFQFSIFFLVGILYAAFSEEPTDAVSRNSIIRGAALTAFMVGLIGTFSEVIARIIPEIMVSLDLIGYTNLPLGNPLVLVITCIGFAFYACLGSVAGAGGAYAFRILKPNKSNEKVKGQSS